MTYPVAYSTAHLEQLDPVLHADAEAFGAALAEVGVALPVLDPDHVLLVLLTAEEP